MCIWDTRVETDSALCCVCGPMEVPLSTRQRGKVLRMGVRQDGGRILYYEVQHSRYDRKGQPGLATVKSG